MSVDDTKHYKGYGLLLSRARRDAGLTQEQLAKALSVHRVTLARWEGGRYLPYPDMQMRIWIKVAVPPVLPLLPIPELRLMAVATTSDMKPSKAAALLGMRHTEYSALAEIVRRHRNQRLDALRELTA